MIDRDVLQSLAGVPGLVLRANESMTKHTTLRVGGPAEAWVVAESAEALEQAAAISKAAGAKQGGGHVDFPSEEHRLLAADDIAQKAAETGAHGAEQDRD